MTIRCSHSSGSVLVIVLVLACVIGLTLASYLHLVSNQNISVMRSMAWNSAVMVAEAGIEEAMAHLHRNGSNRVSDGWIESGTNVIKERFISGNKFKVHVNRDVDPPEITSEGHVANPKTGALLPRPRVIRVGTTNHALFAKGLVAKRDIDLLGNRIRTDSYDSADPNHSTPEGRYDPATFKDRGDIATNSSVIDTLNIWNAEIFGKASTGPGGNVKLGAQGSVGSKAWHAAGNKGIQPGWSTDDMNVYFPDVKLPFSGGGYNPMSGLYRDKEYKFILGNGNFEMQNLRLSADEQMLIVGSAVLVVKGDVDITGNASITIVPGGRLQLYMVGTTATLAGNGVINETGKARNFGYWGLKTNLELRLQGNFDFAGTVYAPYARLTLGGGGNDTLDFMGASVTDRVRMEGKVHFHYDEDLGNKGPRRGYTIVSWNEITVEEI